MKNLEPDVNMADVAWPVVKMIRMFLFISTILLIDSFYSARRHTFSKSFTYVILLSAAVFHTSIDDSYTNSGLGSGMSLE